jgi:hypothetical protein
MADSHPIDPERKPRLLEQLREATRYKHYSYRTEQAYVHWVRRFILFCGKRHPATWVRRRSPGSSTISPWTAKWLLRRKLAPAASLNLTA